jgi:hypothetical protein
VATDPIVVAENDVELASDSGGRTAIEVPPGQALRLLSIEEAGIELEQERQ